MEEQSENLYFCGDNGIFLKLCCVFVFLYIMHRRSRVGFVFVKNSIDDKFLSFTCLISISFYFTLAESVVEMLHVWQYFFCV